MKKKLYPMPWKVMDEVIGDNRKWTNAGIAMTVTGLALTAVGFAMTVSSRVLLRPSRRNTFQYWDSTFMILLPMVTKFIVVPFFRCQGQRRQPLVCRRWDGCGNQLTSLPSSS